MVRPLRPRLSVVARFYCSSFQESSKMYKKPNLVYGPKDIFVPPSLNYGEHLLEMLWKFRDKEMINADTEKRVKFSEIVQQSMNLAISLGRIGLRKGQVVAICSENRDEYFPTVIGVICAGGIATTVNTGYTKGELSHVMGISKPKYIVCSTSFYEKYEKTLRNFDFIRKIIVFGETRHLETYCYNDLVIPGKEVKINGRYVKCLEADVKLDEFEPIEVQGQVDTALVLYSSGTTGLPKGVMLTHFNLIVTSYIPSSGVEIPYTLTIAPWYHVMGLVGNLTVLAKGRTIVYLPKFNIDTYLKAVEKYRITQLTLVPPVLVALCKHDIKYDVSSVVTIYSGAAPLHKDTLDAVKIKFPTVKAILQGYGMTECTLAVCRQVYYPDKVFKLGCVGRVTAYSVIKIADLETGAPLGPNQRGEVRIKGPIVMKGYIGKDINKDLDEDGFFKTGDIGYYDEDKEFFIVDRLKELIKYKGYQVPPAEIEAVLLQHPGIRDAGVVGVEHRSAGEVPLAFVVPQPGVTLTEDDVKQFVAETLSNPKHLRGGVRFVTEIPKNPSGKILRKTLRVMARSGKSKL